MALGSRKLRIVGLAVLVVGGGAGAVWGAKYWSGRRAEQAALAKLTRGDAAEMRAGLMALSKEDLSGPEAAATRRKAMENMRRIPFEEMAKLREAEDSLPEDQRRELREKMGELMRGYMDDRVNEYFTAPKEEKEKIFDKHIDEWQKFMEEMRAYREKHKDDPNQQQREERWRQQRPRRDTQQAKERMEGGNPDQQAKMVYYMSQMRARAQARGIEMGGRGFGFWGGGRGGPGGPPGRGGTGSGGRPEGGSRP